MHISPLAALVVWIPIGVYLFRRYPVRLAILANFLAGWALLPGAAYVPTADDTFPYWILGVCLPTAHFLTKATAVGLSALAGILLFHRTSLAAFRPKLFDLPMAVWCCVPLLSAATHWNTIVPGVRGSVYQTIAWGVPWILGRIYLSNRESLLLAARAYVAAAVCYIPVCLIELVTGPQLYSFCYGYQPYRWVGASRYIGFRPIGFLEDGNQLGIWMAAATLVAVTLAMRRLATRILGLPAAWVAGGLAVTTLLCQSAGSIILLLVLLPLTLLQRRAVLRILVALLIVAIVVFALFRMSNRVSLRYVAQHSATLRALAQDLGSVGRQSVLWRLGRDESHMAVALQKPVLGTGDWAWWQHGDSRPWSLWLLIFGMYGAVGLAAFAAILFLPVLRSAWSPPPNRNNPQEPSLRLALAGLILMVALDDLLNGAMILPYLLVMGALASRNPVRSLPVQRLK